jgi:hypothetical protein
MRRLQVQIEVKVTGMMIMFVTLYIANLDLGGIVSFRPTVRLSDRD